MKNSLDNVSEITILLSGNGKFILDIKYKDFIIEEGRKLFNMLKENKFEEFLISLRELHEFIKKNGRPTEVLKEVDIIIPPLNINPEDLKKIFI
jgi:hypothetical protein